MCVFASGCVCVKNLIEFRVCAAFIVLLQVSVMHYNWIIAFTLLMAAVQQKQTNVSNIIKKRVLFLPLSSQNLIEIKKKSSEKS